MVWASLAGNGIDGFADNFGDCDALGEVADIELEIGGDGGGSVDGEPGPFRFPEAFGLDGHAVGAHGQIDNHVVARAVGCAFGFQVGLLTGYRDRGAGDYSAGGVGDIAGNASGIGLREGHAWKEKGCGESEDSQCGSENGLSVCGTWHAQLQS